MNHGPPPRAKVDIGSKVGERNQWELLIALGNHPSNEN